MLTVYSLCTGDKYATSYVYTLKRMVEQNLSLPHQFVCITDRSLDGIDTRTIEGIYPGWWAKLQILGFTGPSLWLDLDVVLTGPLDDLIGTTKTLKIALNWAQSGHGGCQSSVMYWEDARRIPAAFDYDKYACWPPFSVPGKLYGDQEFITHLRDNEGLEVEYFSKAHVKSYKYHCRGQAVPPDMRVCVFHGKPDPHECSEDWIVEARA